MEIESEKYDVVLIIGNGFDINLDLKTHYSDFIRSDYFKDLVLNKNGLAEYLDKNKDLNNWIDIENALKGYSEQSPPSKKYEKEYNELSKELMFYLKTIKYENLNRERKAYKIIMNITKEKTALILDFNYTSTIKHILDEIKIDIPEIDKRITHLKVHGAVDNDNIIFGVEDGSSIQHKYIFLQKSVAENFCTTNFSKIMFKSNAIVFFGHSLGETDHSYFQDFFNGISIQEDSNKSILIHYYGKSGRNDILYQINKLTGGRIGKFRQYNSVHFIDAKINNQ